jgi:C-terminal processing protease CtpA/Prc
MDESVRRQLDQLMAEHKEILVKTPHWVIDCRNNGGGSDITYRKITPYLYTNRTLHYHNKVWCTRDNAQKYAELASSNDFPWYYKLYGRYMYRRIMRNVGKMVGKNGTVKGLRGKFKPYPKRVAILINGGCASSCESFVQVAQQSKKVTLIGTNTAGISDYGNLHTLTFPCKKFTMRYPTTRTNAVDAGKGIDGVGIPPQVRLDEQTDWIEYARKYLKNK